MISTLRQSVYCPNCHYVSFDLYLSRRQCIKCHNEQLLPRKVTLQVANSKELAKINIVPEDNNEIYNILGE